MRQDKLSSGETCQTQKNGIRANQSLYIYLKREKGKDGEGGEKHTYTRIQLPYMQLPFQGQETHPAVPASWKRTMPVCRGFPQPWKHYRESTKFLPWWFYGLFSLSRMIRARHCWLSMSAWPLGLVRPSGLSDVARWRLRRFSGSDVWSEWTHGGLFSLHNKPDPRPFYHAPPSPALYRTLSYPHLYSKRGCSPSAGSSHPLLGLDLATVLAILGHQTRCATPPGIVYWTVHSF